MVGPPPPPTGAEVVAGVGAGVEAGVGLGFGAEVGAGPLPQVPNLCVFDSKESLLLAEAISSPFTLSE